MSKTVRAFLISDLHAFDKTTLGRNEDEPSFVDVSKGDSDPSSNPLLSLREQVIKVNNISADLLICCGDYADKAHPTALNYAWERVIKLKSHLNARTFAATVGNHDVDSTYKYNDHDAIGHIQSLAPLFPVKQATKADHFWSRHFYVIEEPSYRVIVLNSSAFHNSVVKERKHGRIAPYTLERIKSFIERKGTKPINLLVCHHHPQKHAELKLGGYDQMEGGDELLRALDSSWIVIHGHKHHPKICYATGANDSPIIFSAGSLSARLYPELANQVRNQCYLLEFPLDAIKSMGLVGRFRAWDWNVGTGWSPASIPNPKAKYSGLPSEGGFGTRANCRSLANEIGKTIRRKNSWSAVTDRHPNILYLLPHDLRQLVTELERSKMRVLIDDTGRIQEIQPK